MASLSFPCALEGKTQVVAGVEMLRIEPQGAAVTVHRLGELSLRFEDYAQVAERVGELRIELECPPATPRRVVKPVLTLEDQAEIGMVMCRRGIQFDGLTNQRGRFLQVASAVFQDAE